MNIKTHGLSNTKIYKTWAAMKSRCQYSKNVYFHNYGGRGISVSEEWNNFDNFFRNMGNKPSDAHELDRIDNNGNYCKENCKWSTKTENGCNKRSNKILIHNGEAKCIREWARYFDFNVHTFECRIQRGWSMEKTLKTPVKNTNNKQGSRNPTRYDYNGEKLTIYELSKISGVHASTLHNRIKNGQDVVTATNKKARFKAVRMP